MKKFTKLNLIATILLLPVSVWAAMSSTNYTIYADSVETGGGLSSGGVYRLEDTIGEGVVSQSSSSTYDIKAGYQAMVLGSLSMNIDNTSLNFGTLSTTTVSLVTTTVTVTADAESGYSMSVQSMSWTGTPLTDVNDGTVTAGQEEYGIAVSGADIPLLPTPFTDDRSIEAGRLLATKSSPAIGSQTVLSFKAAISSGTSVGSRSQTVVIGVSANF